MRTCSSTSASRSSPAAATGPLAPGQMRPSTSIAQQSQIMGLGCLPLAAVRSSACPATTSITTRPASPFCQAEQSRATAPTSTATAMAARRCPMAASPSIDMTPRRQRASWSTRRRSIMGQVIRKIALSLALVALAWPLLAAAPAQAGSTRTWVSGATTADDMNPCSRTAPCKTFAGALANTLPGGEINCLDPGDFGKATPGDFGISMVTITFSVTISCEAGTAGVLLPVGFSSSGITINAATTDVVTLRGLDIDGQGSGTVGIKILQAQEVHVEKSTVRNFRNGGSGGVAIYSLASSTTFLYVADSVMSDSGFGVSLNNFGGFKVASLKNVVITGSTSDGVTLLSGDSYANITESIISGNGGSAVMAKLGSTVNIDRSMIANNGTGLNVAHSGSTIRASGNNIYNNTTGIFIGPGGTIQSDGTNKHGNSNG